MHPFIVCIDEENAEAKLRLQGPAATQMPTKAKGSVGVGRWGSLLPVPSFL